MRPLRYDGPWHHEGPRLLRTVSETLADHCPRPDTEAALIRLQISAYERGLLGRGAALSGVSTVSAALQTQSPPVDLGATVNLAGPPSARPRQQRQRARPILALAAATAVAMIVALPALLSTRSYHGTVVPNTSRASAQPSALHTQPVLRLQDIAGIWTGVSTQGPPVSLKFRLRLTIRAGYVLIQQFSSVSTSPTAGCSARLLPGGATSRQLQLQLIPTESCAQGIITLIPHANQTLTFRFQGKPASLTTTGTFTRRKG